VIVLPTTGWPRIRTRAVAVANIVIPVVIAALTCGVASAFAPIPVKADNGVTRRRRRKASSCADARL